MRYLTVAGIDRLCASSSHGKLYFYQLSEEIPDQSDSVIEGDLTPTGESVDGLFGLESGKLSDDIEHPHRSAGNFGIFSVIFMNYFLPQSKNHKL